MIDSPSGRSGYSLTANFHSCSGKGRKKMFSYHIIMLLTVSCIFFFVVACVYTRSESPALFVYIEYATSRSCSVLFVILNKTMTNSHSDSIPPSKYMGHCRALCSNFFYYLHCVLCSSSTVSLNVCVCVCCLLPVQKISNLSLTHTHERTHAVARCADVYR